MADTAQQATENYQVSLHESFPVGTKGVWTEKKPDGRYSLVNEDISLPAAVILKDALDNNIAWMQHFADQHKAALCPHGKTSMTPALFKAQLEKGAWGLTVASPAQVEIAALCGAKNIIIANQLVGKANMAAIAAMQQAFPVTVYCCVDSEENLQALSDYFAQRSACIHVLIELGVPQGRCGERTPEDARKLAAFAHALPGIALSGIEFYEGVIHGEDAEAAVHDFVESCAAFCEQLVNEQLIDTEKAIITGAGSAWYDVVAAIFTRYSALLPVIRPGCYVTHDTGIYEQSQRAVIDRLAKQQRRGDFEGDLRNALEVWAYVISTPEKGKAVIGLGKRDTAYDAGLPKPERGFRNGKAIDVEGIVATKVMDQHMFVNVPDDLDIKVGDIIAFSGSHPCLTFDKWRFIALADNTFMVENWLSTQF